MHRSVKLPFGFSPVVVLVSCCAAASVCRGQEIRDVVSFANDILPVVKNFCATCHAGKNPEGKIGLTSYAEVRRQVEKGKLLARINDANKPMPPDGLLPVYLRRLFRRWAEGGYVNETRDSVPAREQKYADFKPPPIEPVDLRKQGFDLLERMQGHWIGSMYLLGQNYDWMAFDFRAIAPSHVHGIYEGGTIGNLFTSFFVTDFKGRRTIMARNGGILNGIYRTSYFVLDRVDSRRGRHSYRLVDAYGGKDIMWMELTFAGDRLTWNAYTSRFGLTQPKLHMSFKARRMHSELAVAAARAVGFPKNIVDRDFSAGLPTPSWADEYPLTSASYIHEDATKSLLELAKLARDPYRIDQMPYVSKLSVSIRRSPVMENKTLHVYLSMRSLTDRSGRFLTDRFGYVRGDLLNGLLQFPELSGGENQFTFTYLHPGEYYLTVIADMDADGYPSPGDVTHASRRITVRPKTHEHVQVAGPWVRN